MALKPRQVQKSLNLSRVNGSEDQDKVEYLTFYTDMTLNDRFSQT